MDGHFICVPFHVNVCDCYMGQYATSGSELKKRQSYSLRYAYTGLRYTFKKCCGKDACRVPFQTLFSNVAWTGCDPPWRIGGDDVLVVPVVVWIYADNLACTGDHAETTPDDYDGRIICYELAEYI